MTDHLPLSNLPLSDLPLSHQTPLTPTAPLAPPLEDKEPVGLNPVSLKEYYKVSKVSNIFQGRGYKYWRVIEVPGGWRSTGEALLEYGDGKSLIGTSPTSGMTVGRWLKEQHSRLGVNGDILVLQSARVIIMPTKPVTIYDSPPYASWKNPTSVTMVMRGLSQIVAMKPSPGLIMRPPGTCGEYGPLKLRKSMRLLKKHLVPALKKDGIPLVVLSCDL